MTRTDTESIPATKIMLHPNPTTDEFQVSGLKGECTIYISDLHCRVLIKKEVVNDDFISLKSIPKGVYVAKIVTGSDILHKKIVKI